VTVLWGNFSMLRKASSAENRAPPVQPLCQIGGDDSSRICYVLVLRMAERVQYGNVWPPQRQACREPRFETGQKRDKESMMNRGRELCSKFVASMDEYFTDR